jgi:hypothetical protein
MLFVNGEDRGGTGNHGYYSYFNASTGIIVAARKAGYKPESIPTRIEKTSANNTSQAGV